MNERRDPANPGRRATDQGDWFARHGRTLALWVVAQFIVLAVLAIGIAVTSSTAEDALAVNRLREREIAALRRQVGVLADRNADLIEEVEALRRQVEGLGAVPVSVTVEDTRGAPATVIVPPSPTATAPPPTTTTTQPCRFPLPGGRCLDRPGADGR